MPELASNVLYYGDNLDILRRYCAKVYSSAMTTHPFRWVSPRGAAVLTLLLAACAPAPATSTSAAPSPSASARTVTVTAVDSLFGPDLTITVGTTVVFVNAGGLKHTASHGVDGQLAEGSLFDLTLEPAASDTFTFDTSGVYPITCIVHPDMNMTITVE